MDTDGLAVDVSFEKDEASGRLTDVAVTIDLPHAVCGDREAAIRRVAEHCPVHATIHTLEEVAFEIRDQGRRAA
jgi:hypothetical protein